MQDLDQLHQRIIAILRLRRICLPVNRTWMWHRKERKERVMYILICNKYCDLMLSLKVWMLVFCDLVNKTEIAVWKFPDTFHEQRCI